MDGAVLAAACYGLYAVGPNADTVKDNLHGSRVSVLNYFVSMSTSCMGSVFLFRFELCAVNNWNGRGGAGGGLLRAVRCGAECRHRERQPARRKGQRALLLCECLA